MEKAQISCLIGNGNIAKKKHQQERQRRKKRRKRGGEEKIAFLLP
jgi:hypothetical protein